MVTLKSHINKIRKIMNSPKYDIYGDVDIDTKIVMSIVEYVNSLSLPELIEILNRKPGLYYHITAVHETGVSIYQVIGDVLLDYFAIELREEKK